MTAAATDVTTSNDVRPRIHFTPARNWMNDPNGLVFHRGVYHLFFQYNPNGLDHGDISWGHATSEDLLHWVEQPVAISYDQSEQIFSGSAVVDETNSSGLGDGETPPMVAVYTSATADGRQAQSLAYSLDDGQSWQKYGGNPVLDRESANFRDPKVFRYRSDDGDHWIMVAVEAEERRVLLYRSDDLLTWNYLSSYGPAGAVGGVWECPDLFPLPLDGNPDVVKWVMLISINPGGVAGGSGTQYVVGDFDGQAFIPDRTPPAIAAGDERLDELMWLDWGRDCYAGVTFSGLPDEQRTLIAWMSNWDYARDIPTLPWRGAMTIARKLSLATAAGVPVLRSAPILPEGEVTEPARRIPATDEAASVRLPAVARVVIAADADAIVDIEISDGTRTARIRVDASVPRIQLDRREASPASAGSRFPSVQTAPLPQGPTRVDATLVVDSGSIEIFAADGMTCLTDQVFLDQPRTLRVCTAEPDATATVTIIDLTREAL